MQGRATIDIEDAVFSAGPAPARTAERKDAAAGGFPFQNRFSGATRVALGFLAGALFALLPVYYYYMGRDAGLRAPHASPSADPAPAASADSGGKPNRFASRMTYELAHLPEEPPRVARPAAPLPAALPASTQAATAPAPMTPPPAATVARALTVTPAPAAAPVAAVPLPAPIPLPAVVAPQPAPAPAAKAVASPPATVQPEPVALSGPRVANARPIRLEPLETRDTTREIAKEARKAEVAEVAPLSRPPQQKAVPAVAQRTQLAVAPSSTAALPTAEAPAAGGESDIVAGRFAATRDWLGSAPGTTHTIQLMGTNSEAQLRNHLKALVKTLEPGKIFVFRTKAQGKPAISVVYGAFPDRKVALQALEKLPPTLTANRPVLRTVNGIRAEMKQHGTS